MKGLIIISGVCFTLSAILIHAGLKGLKDDDIKKSLAYKVGMSQGAIEIMRLKEQLEEAKIREAELRKQLEKKSN